MSHVMSFHVSLVFFSSSFLWTKIVGPRSQYSAWVRRSDGKDFLLNWIFFTKAPHEAETENHRSTAVTFAALDHPQVDNAPGPLVQEDPLDDAGLHDPEPLVHLPNEARPQRPPPAPPDVVRLWRSTAVRNPAYNYTRRYNRTHKAFLM